MAKKNEFICNGLYTDARGKSVVHVYDCYVQYFGLDQRIVVEFENVRGNKGPQDIEKEKFQKRFPHRIDKIVVEFSD